MKKNLALSMHAANRPYSEIASFCGISETTARSWCDPEAYRRKRERDKRSRLERSKAFRERLAADLEQVAKNLQPLPQNSAFDSVNYT